MPQNLCEDRRAEDTSCACTSGLLDQMTAASLQKSAKCFIQAFDLELILTSSRCLQYFSLTPSQGRFSVQCCKPTANADLFHSDVRAAALTSRFPRVHMLCNALPFSSISETDAQGISCCSCIDPKSGQDPPHLCV